MSCKTPRYRHRADPTGSGAAYHSRVRRQGRLFAGFDRLRHGDERSLQQRRDVSSEDTHDSFIGVMFATQRAINAMVGVVAYYFMRYYYISMMRSSICLPKHGLRRTLVSPNGIEHVYARLIVLRQINFCGRNIIRSTMIILSKFIVSTGALIVAHLRSLTVRKKMPQKEKNATPTVG